MPTYTVSTVHIAVDTLGHLLALKGTAASEGDREQVALCGARAERSLLPAHKKIRSILISDPICLILNPDNISLISVYD